MFGLKEILKPVTIDTFLSEFAGAKAVHIPGPEEKFENLYGWEEINHVLNGMRPSMEGVRLVYEKQPLASQEMTRAGQWLGRGATLVINHVQHIDPITHQFAESLANDMNSSVNINCYTSFPSKQGFDCHYDSHDVFVVQTRGEKLWKVFEPTRLHPLDRDPAADKDTAPKPDYEPYLECTLTPGDVLYIPRGHWHYAVSETPCVHLTVSYSNRSGIDFLLWLLNELRQNDDFLRQDFPVCRIESLAGDRDEDGLRAHLDRFRKRMVEVLNNDDLSEKLLYWAQVENPLRQVYQLPELADLDQHPITREMMFAVPDNQKFIPLHDAESGQLELLARGKVVRLKRVPKALVEAMLKAGDGFSGEQLLAACPDVSWDNVQMMLKALYLDGLIVLQT